MKDLLFAPATTSLEQLSNKSRASRKLTVEQCSNIHEIIFGSDSLLLYNNKKYLLKKHYYLLETEKTNRVAANCSGTSRECVKWDMPSRTSIIVFTG